MAQITLVEAVNLALKRAMQDDPSVVVLGQDVGVDGGVFRATLGLLERFGEERVIDTPLAEALIVGTAIGMAVEGLRPVAEIQFAGFAYTTLDQILNHAGRMRHRDSAGHEGLLENGGVQWMTAGRGVIHSEMPEQEDGVMEGFQLWLNLPAKEKMKPASYRDIPAGDIPTAPLPGGGEVRVIAGSLTVGGAAVHGPVNGAGPKLSTDPLYVDVHLPAGASFTPGDLTRPETE